MSQNFGVEIMIFKKAALPTATPMTASPASRHLAYGSNPAASSYFEHDGVKLYYEVYGKGQPLLLIHGNGGDIWSMKYQINYFRKQYQVIAMDSRDHGRSGDTNGPLTFEAMTDDLAALLDHLHTGPVLVLGWSDGGIEALLLGMRHPGKVMKIAAMAANLDPEGIAPEFLKQQMALPNADPAHAPTRAERVTELYRKEPHIKLDALGAITAPTLVLASDHDFIADGHTLEIYHNLPNAQLAIFPDATHMIPVDDPTRFNTSVERFFHMPFVKKDRVLDMIKSLHRLKKEKRSNSPPHPSD
ncbi:MAG TPA: alpha/beta hydrolase [Rhizomicrobium sp.]|jgi:pimeloyl-ACP methyl ester carboxylesterase|nr:alpha/beta hydrolase [Rhizomicrobium sp.]